uniref:VOC domain-containing protein n=1 Tax=Alexandrium andersonii TaxID=327968 RepID=A0A7S2BL61_9DINO|mmetsp:Transcript_27118/g.61784  ORF Transcript_27118/g.61784 Transcript_27118/m.61784 type:complete len:183 (+) Transcript_27118:71-619(+)
MASLGLCRPVAHMCSSRLMCRSRLWNLTVPSFAVRHKAESITPPQLLGLDHAAIGVRDLSRSLRWYGGVLGMDHVLADDPAFNGDIAMAGVRGAPLLALLRLPENEAPLKGSREQRGHFALRVGNADFERLRETLPALLQAYRAHDGQSLWIEEQDYGRQLSLFFQDPDSNEIEVTTWLRPP